MIGSRGRRRLAAALALAVSLLARPAAAHPHVFIEHRVEVLFDTAGITGIHLTWSFDELYSASLRSDYTASKQGPITAKDVQSLHDGAFVHLSTVHYFTTVIVNDQPIALGEPKDFTAHFDGGKAVYSFVIPLNAPRKPGNNTVEITVFDPEYYVDFELASKDPVSTGGADKTGAKCIAGLVKRPTIGWGEVDSDAVTCTYRS